MNMNKPPNETLKQGRNRSWLLVKFAGAQGRPKTATTVAIQQRINTLNERFTSHEIGLNELLDGLALTVAKQCK